MLHVWQQEAIAEVFGVPLHILLQRNVPIQRLAATPEGRQLQSAWGSVGGGQCGG